MKQKNCQILIFTILLGLILSSCKKEDINIDINSSNWEVVKIKKQGEFFYKKAKGVYILSFVNDTQYSLNLDANHCGGQYEIINDGNIIISDMTCTAICCESDFAQDLSLLFPEMTEYYGKGNRLILEGQGEIILKKH